MIVLNELVQFKGFCPYQGKDLPLSLALAHFVPAVASLTPKTAFFSLWSPTVLLMGAKILGSLTTLRQSLLCRHCRLQLGPRRVKAQS